MGVGGAALGTAAAAGAAIPAGSEPTATAADPTAPDTRPEVAAAPSAAAAAAAADGAAIAADFSTAETRSMDAPDAAPAPLTASGAGASGVRPRRMLPVGLAIAGVAVVAAVAIAASNMLGGGGGAPTASPAPSIAIVPSASPSPSIATPSPSPVVTPSPSPSPSLAPTPTPTPAGRQARITSITVSGGRYLVDYDVFNFTPQAARTAATSTSSSTRSRWPTPGVPGKGPWELYAGPVPFDVYRVSDKPSGATGRCACSSPGPIIPSSRTPATASTSPPEGPRQPMIDGSAPGTVATGTPVDLAGEVRRIADLTRRVADGTDHATAVDAVVAPPRRAAARRDRRAGQGRQVDAPQRACRRAAGGDRRRRVHPDRDVVPPRDSAIA